MANDILKTLEIDGVALDVPEAGQDYTAGTNIQINNGVISATDTKYTAGTNLALSGTTFSLATSPALTGTPTAPTAAATTNNTQIATTAMVQAAINRRLPKSTNVSYSNTSAVSVANNTEVSWDLWTAPAAGIIIANAYVRFVANATGRRGLLIKVNGGGVGSGIQVMASPSGTTILSAALMRHVTSGSKIQMVVSHSAGAALNVDNRFINGIFIPD